MKISQKIGRGGNKYGIPSKSHLASTNRKTIYGWQHLLRASDPTLEVYNSLPFESDEDKMIMSKVLKLMEKQYIGQTDVIYERYCFNNRIQETGESFDAYLTAHKALAKTCNSGSLKDELIRDSIVCGIRDMGTRINYSKKPD